MQLQMHFAHGKSKPESIHREVCLQKYTAILFPIFSEKKNRGEQLKPQSHERINIVVSHWRLLARDLRKLTFFIHLQSTVTSLAIYVAFYNLFRKCN